MAENLNELSYMTEEAKTDIKRILDVTSGGGSDGVELVNIGASLSNIPVAQTTSISSQTVTFQQTLKPSTTYTIISVVSIGGIGGFLSIAPTSFFVTSNENGNVQLTLTIMFTQDGSISAETIGGGVSIILCEQSYFGN